MNMKRMIAAAAAAGVLLMTPAGAEAAKDVNRDGGKTVLKEIKAKPVRTIMMGDKVVKYKSKVKPVSIQVLTVYRKDVTRLGVVKKDKDGTLSWTPRAKYLKYLTDDVFSVTTFKGGKWMMKMHKVRAEVE